MICHEDYGDCLVGRRLLGFATKIDFVKSNNPFNSKKQLKLKKTRARNSECYIDQILEINEDRESLEAVAGKVKKFCDDSKKLNSPENLQVFYDLEHSISGKMLVLFCEDFGKIEKEPQKHGHNWQRVKGKGNPARCIVDEPLRV